jgi:hypothetical protein
MVPALPHVLISSFLETSRRQIVASVTVRFPGSSSEFGGPKTDQVKRLKELEKDNERLRKLFHSLQREAKILTRSVTPHS